MNFYRKFMRLLAAVVCMLFSWQVVAGACDNLAEESGNAPGALGVLDGGTIKIAQNGGANCTIVFSGDSSVINAASGNYTTRGTGCVSASGGVVEETGTTLSKLTGLTFESADSSGAEVYYKNSGQEIKVIHSSVSSTYSLKGSSSKPTYRWCKDNTGNACNNDDKHDASYVEYTSHLNTGWMKFPTYSNNVFYFDNGSGTARDYKKISIDGSKPAYFRYDGSLDPYRIDTLYMTNSATVTFEPGTYYIGTWSTGSTITVNVANSGGDGSGIVKLYVKSMSWSNVNGSCINVSSCTYPLVTTDTAEHPERLYIYVMSGDFKVNDRVNMAAGIYVPEGTFDFGTNSSTLIGEIVAKSVVLQNGTPMSVIYKDTLMFSNLYTAATIVEAPKEGTYSLAAPAVPREAATGDLVYVAYQTDYYENADGTVASYISGNLKAFKLNADGTTDTTPTWNADDEMTVAERKDRLWSVNNSGKLVKFPSMDNAAFSTSGSPSVSDIINYTMDPNYSSTYLGKRDPNSLLGRPYITQPVIMGDLVLFQTDDGFLYAVDSETGDLKWGYMPRTLVAGLQDYTGFMDTHPMAGQIAQFTTGNGNEGYVVATAKGGELVYALKVASDGSLGDQLWVETNSNTVTHRPVVFNIGTDYYALYLQGGAKVALTKLSSTASAKVYDLGGTTGNLTAAPIVLETFVLSGSTRDQYLTLYVGDDQGNVYEALLSKAGSISNSLSLTKVGNMGGSSTETDSVQFLQTATLGGYDYVTAQSESRLKAFRLPDSSTWRSDWRSIVSESGYWNDAGTSYTQETKFTPNTEHIQKLPSNATITDQVEIAESVVFLPVQLEVAATATADESCDAYYYLYRLDDGYFPYNTLKLKSPVTDNVKIGTGKAYKPSITVFNGSVTLEGHSEKNNEDSLGTTPLGLDDPFSFTKGEQGISGWRELVDE